MEKGVECFLCRRLFPPLGEGADEYISQGLCCATHIFEDCVEGFYGSTSYDMNTVAFANGIPETWKVGANICDICVTDAIASGILLSPSDYHDDDHGKCEFRHLMSRIKVNIISHLVMELRAIASTPVLSKVVKNLKFSYFDPETGSFQCFFTLDDCVGNFTHSANYDATDLHCLNVKCDAETRKCRFKEKVCCKDLSPYISSLCKKSGKCSIASSQEEIASFFMEYPFVKIYKSLSEKVALNIMK